MAGLGPLRLGACPKLHELDLIEGCGKQVRVIKSGASKWEHIATRFHFEGCIITQIFGESQNNMQRACRVTFTKWLEGMNGLREPRTWNTVIKVLKEAELGQLAKDLETVLRCDETAALSSAPQQPQMQKPSSKHFPIIPPKTEWTFPLLKDDNMEPEDYEKLKARLYAESESIAERFVDVYTNFFQSLGDRKIPIKKLVAHLKTFVAFTPICKVENQPLLKDDLSKLNFETADMEDIMTIVNNYCSFFNYRVLSYLVKKHGAPSDQEALKQYEMEFTEYAKRRVFECPSEIGEMNQRCANLIVKLDDSYDQCSVNQLGLLEHDLCKTFGISNLNLRRIEQGCLQLTFQLPVFVQEAIFPLSQEQEEKLIALHVLRMDSGDYHFTCEGSSGALSSEVQVNSDGTQCTDCGGGGGGFELRCKTHYICENCLEVRVINQPENVLRCASCTSTPKRKLPQTSTILSYKEALLKPREKVSSSAAISPKQFAKRAVESSEERCWIFVYDSNIWITAKKLQSQRKKFKTGEDHRVRIDVGKLGDVLAGGRTIEKGTLYGSKPPNIDTVWKKIEEMGWIVETRHRDEGGKEKLHTKMVADVVDVAFKTPPEQRSTIILVTGDANIIPAIEVILDNDKHWKIEVYMWSQAISRKFNPTKEKYGGRLEIEQLDDYINDVTFTSMKFDTKNQAFSNTLHKNGVVFVMKDGAFPDQVPTHDWIRKLEGLAKWPFQYYWLKEDNESQTNNLVVVFRKDEKAGQFEIANFMKSLIPITCSASQEPYRIPMVQRALTYEEFEKELEVGGEEEESTVHYIFEQVGIFTREHVYQGFHNGLVYYIPSYKPGPAYRFMAPFLDWYYKYASLQ